MLKILQDNKKHEEEAHKLRQEIDAIISSLKETQVEYGGIGIVCSDGQIRMLNEKKD